MTLAYADLLQDLRTRTSRAHASLLAPRSLVLRHWLEAELGATPGSPNALLSTPVFEHKFGFQTVEETLADLSPELVAPELLEQLDAPAAHPDERFPRDRKPYTHQVQAWRALADNKSVIVSAGTGGGKTECFVVPILSDLVAQATAQRTTLEGVQALFLYPLNALINSQRERLSAWTRGLNGKVRYCLYNGETPTSVKNANQRAEPERVMSRKLLRSSPPPMLITNATMLEYMLVRPDDAPILAKSKGKLKYIVVDEAHTYVGSMAAELSLLLRRVMTAFEVDPENVQVIATSATLSSDDQGSGRGDVQQFLADLAGQPLKRVEVVTDQRHIPELPEVEPAHDLPDLDVLEDLPSDAERFDALVRTKAARLLRENLVAQNGRTVRDLCSALEDAGMEMESDQVVRLLDVGTRAYPAKDEEAFLPLRGHAFARGLEGLWACLNPDCKGRPSDEANTDWPYGRVYTARRDHCADCKSPTYEVALCLQCGHDHLVARMVSRNEGDALVPCTFDQDAPIDDMEDAEPNDDEAAAEDQTPDLDAAEQRVFFTLVPDGGADDIDVSSGKLDMGDRQALWPEDDKPSCVRCGYKGRGERGFARPCRTGRNFLLSVAVPTLLEAMPPVKKHASLPFEGRRTITFTDSRQGTARFAASAQGAAERNFIRSFVYHTLLNEMPSQATYRRELAALEEKEAQVAQLPDPSAFSALVEGVKAERVALEAKYASPSLPLRTVSDQLAGTAEFKALQRYWQRYLPFQQDREINEREFAFWLVLREFARRPMRRASLETLGLVSVRYDHLDTRREPPLEWTRRTGEHAASSWADFLKLCLDFYVRSNSAIRLDSGTAFFRWVGTRITPKVVGGPESEGEKNRRVTWPSAGSNSRLEGLLRRALGLTESDGESNAIVDDLFRQAWLRIAVDDLMVATLDRGRALKPSAIRLGLVREAWLCPITRTLLDTTLLGHSPYAPAKGFDLPTTCRKVTMPTAPYPWGRRHPDTDLTAMRGWLETDPRVQEARAAGAISEFTERILEFHEYFQTAEHSAQIPSAALKAAERDFKRGQLNVLSCSTTMEMGVDIGNLSGVAMNNAPPSPANFLQRVGRAGRRGESAAASLTVCRQMPHDQGVFQQPDWPFRTPMHITPVKLDSEPIVVRHVRALLLTRFLAEHAPDDRAHRLTCAWLFVAPDEGTAMVTHLIAWLRNPTKVEAMRRPLTQLVHETVLDGVDAEALMAAAIPVFEGKAARFDELRDALKAELLALPVSEREDSPAAFRIQRDLVRLEREYLLSYLADEQVLPGYGFPSGVLPFVSTTLEELRALKKEVERAKKRNDDEDPEVAQARIDAHARLSGVASRDLPMAIREYAPGSTIVLDRRSYVSRGVRLAWQLPASATESDLGGIQALRNAWRCRACGAAGTSQVGRLEACPSCGAGLPGGSEHQPEFLLPSGFATDLFEDAQMEASHSPFVPVQRPWISSGDGPFRGIGRAVMVRWRHTPSGEIVHLSSGAHGHGYALCLRCGRAEPETEAEVDELPSRMKDHRRLRGGKNSDWNTSKPGEPCEGNAESGWAVKRNLRLGGSLYTDVLELHLQDPHEKHWCSDRTVMTTAAVALRTVAAQRLGVDAREIGYAVSGREDADGHRFLAILLYDTASGGAGFVAQIPPLLPELLRETAATSRDCPRDCDRVCHGCLLSHDTQHDDAQLNRKALAPTGQHDAVLGQTFLHALQLPPELSPYGDTSRMLIVDPVESLMTAARRRLREGPAQITLFVDGDPSAWDPVAWSGRGTLRRLAALGDALSVRLAAPVGAFTGLDDWQLARQLAGLVELEGLTLAEVDELPTDGPLHRWVELTTATETIAWGSASEPATLDTTWPATDASAVQVRGRAEPTPMARAVNAADLASVPAERVVPFDVGAVASGPSDQLGRRILETANVAAPGFLDELKARGAADEIVLHDRYLKSPLVVHIAHGMLMELRAAGLVSSSTHVEVVTVAPNNQRHPELVEHDWGSATAHSDVLNALMGSVSPSAKVTIVRGRDTRKTQHYRCIEMRWGTETLELRLDQGFGFVATDRRQRFPFGRPVGEQINELLSGRWKLRRHGPRHHVPAYVVRE